MRFVFIVFFLVSTAFAEDNVAKLPVPTDVDLASQRKVLNEIFGDRIEAANTGSAKSELAEELLSIAETTDDRYERYAVLDQVKKLAVANSDMTLAFHTIDIVAETFDVDKLKLRTATLADLTAGKLDEESLRQLVEQDMAAEADPQKSLVAADAWYRLSENLNDSFKQSAKDRAITHYQTALLDLTGLRKLQIQNRIEECQKNDSSPNTTPKVMSNRRSRGRIVEIDCTKGLSSLEAQKAQQDAAKAYGVPIEASNKIGMRFRFIPAGTFVMGSPETEPHRGRGEEQTTVKIFEPFYMGMTEVTQEQYWKVTGQKPSHFKDKPNHPVEMVSWADAMDFCEKLTKLDGKRKYRLPDEAQWEYACRAGTLETTYGPLDKIAWTKNNSQDMTHPVGLLAPNAWGLYDCIGNEWERCSEGYTPSSRVRGGCYLSDVAQGRWLRSAARHNDPNRYFAIGFRVIMLIED